MMLRRHLHTTLPTGVLLRQECQQHMLQRRQAKHIVLLNSKIEMCTGTSEL